MSRILVIFNPAARGEKAGQLADRIRRLSSRAVIRTTLAPGDAEAIAERAVEQGYSTIVAAGGDGTINEVVNGIGEADVSLGILPVGTMNVFAAELGLPSDIRKCWDIIEEGETRRIDLPKANDQYFVQLAGVGLDAQVVKETSWDFRKNFGPLSYLVSATRIAAQKPPVLRLSLDGGRKVEGCFALIGNGRFYGGPVTFFQDAKIDDGLLDILIFRNQGHLDIIRYLQGILFGNPREMRDVTYLQSATAKITSPDEVPFEVDGELLGILPVDIRMTAKGLRVLARPTGSSRGSGKKRS